MVQKKQRKQELQVETRWLLELLWKKLWLIVLVTAVCITAALVVTRLFVTPLYRSSALFYVNNYISVGEEEIVVIGSSDLNAAQKLVDSYLVILKTGDTLDAVIAEAAVDRTAAELREMVSAAAVNATEIFEITVTGPDAQEARRIAQAITAVLPQRIKGIIQSTSAKIVDTAVVPSSASFPSYGLNGLIGLLIGLLTSVTFVIIRGLTDIRIRGEEDIVCSHPVLVSVPDMTVMSSGGYYGGRKTRQQKRTHPVLLGKDISFAAMESYKLLRTKLSFCFPDSSGGRVIGVSSAMAGEGKSLSATNLAYALSRTGDEVVLLDCDLRRPTVAAKLRIKRSPGLSDYLTGHSTLEDVLRGCGLPGERDAFRVIPAGSETPNPIELLDSPKMRALVAELRHGYDYVILDLPPVGEVSDALVMSEQTDGVLLVVRRNYCTRPAFTAMIQQFEFVQARILGIICNCTAENAEGYTGRYFKRSYRPRFTKKQK